jgi:hypothetical protein
MPMGLGPAIQVFLCSPIARRGWPAFGFIQGGAADGRCGLVMTGTGNSPGCLSQRGWQLPALAGAWYCRVRVPLGG